MITYRLFSYLDYGIENASLGLYEVFINDETGDVESCLPEPIVVGDSIDEIKAKLLEMSESLDSHPEPVFTIEMRPYE